MIIAIIMAAVGVVLSCIMSLHAILTAPEGYQDDTGFHYGEPPEMKEPEE